MNKSQSLITGNSEFPGTLHFDYFSPTQLEILGKSSFNNVSNI